MSDVLQSNQSDNLEVKEEQPKVNLEVKEDKKPLAESFQRIAKQEKFVADERKKIEEAKKSMEVDRGLADSYKQLKGKNPFEILEHFGITYEQLLRADKERANPIDPHVKKALERVQELESKVSLREKEVEEAKLAKAEVQLKADIDAEIKANEYDLIEKLGAKDAVKEFMEEIYNTTGEIPTIKEACEAVTAHIAEKYSSIKDSKWLKPKEVVEQKKEEETIKSPVINNKMTQTSEHSNKPLTEQQRLQHAIQVMAAMAK